MLIHFSFGAKSPICENQLLRSKRRSNSTFFDQSSILYPNVFNPTQRTMKMNDLTHKRNVINTLFICSSTRTSSSLSFLFNKSSLEPSPTLNNYATRLLQNEHKFSVRNSVHTYPLRKRSFIFTVWLRVHTNPSRNGSFISAVRPTVQTNPSRKRSVIYAV